MRAITATLPFPDRQQRQPPHLEAFLLVCDQHEAKQRLEFLLLQGRVLLGDLLNSERAASADPSRTRHTTSPTSAATTRPAAAASEERPRPIQSSQHQVERHLAKLRKLRWRFWHVHMRLSSHRAKQAMQPGQEAKHDAVACMAIDLGAHERLLDNIIRHLRDYVHCPDPTMLPALNDLYSVEDIKVEAGNPV